MPIAHATHAPSSPSAASAFPAEFVRRPRLVERLRVGHGNALGVIVAPPGYGKSSLIAEWAQADERRFAWVRFAPADVVGAADDLIADVLTWLRCEDDACVVVLDDAHMLPSGLLRDAIASIREHLPDGSSVAVVARSEPDLPLGRLRAHRALVEIRSADLAMTPAEAAALLRRSGLRLDFTEVQTLVRRTEGWPAALYLAALSMSEPTLGATAVADFRGDDHLLVEYLHDEVLQSLPNAAIVFLRRLSILEELSDGVCDATLGRRGTTARLQKLARSTSLLQAVDPAHDRYRWHPLFRETLRAELRRREPSLIPVLHARASAWYADHGDFVAATRHAVEAGDAQRTGQLVWSHLVSHLTVDGLELLRGWLSQFQRDTIAGSPTLSVSAACVALMEGKAETAVRYARDLTVAAHRADGHPSEFAVAPGLIAAATGAGGVGAMHAAATRGRKALPPNSPWLAACAWLEGVATHLSGADRSVAAHQLDEAASLSGHTFPVLAALALSQRALLAIEDEDWQLAADLADETDALLATSGCEVPITALALATLAAVRAHEGRAAEAKRDLHRASAALASVDDSLAWFGAMTRLVLAHASLHLADVASARTLLAHASRQARRVGEIAAFSAWFADAWSYLDSLAETSLAGPSALTIAELRVLRFLPSCRTFREIAEQLGVSANTVKTQAHAVYRKLGAASRSEAVLRARDAGLLGT